MLLKKLNNFSCDVIKVKYIGLRTYLVISYLCLSFPKEEKRRKKSLTVRFSLPWDVTKKCWVFESSENKKEENCLRFRDFSTNNFLVEFFGRKFNFQKRVVLPWMTHFPPPQKKNSTSIKFCTTLSMRAIIVSKMYNWRLKLKIFLLSKHTKKGDKNAPKVS